MATGEYVSVSSQADTEKAALAEEKAELENDGPHEHRELAAIYEQRGLTPALAGEVALAMHAHDALQAHLRDELGHTEAAAARPVQAALASAASFLLGGLVPFAGLLAHGSAARSWTIVAVTLAGLLIAGLAAARAAGGALVRPAVRVLVGGALAMAVTALVGQLAHVGGL